MDLRIEKKLGPEIVPFVDALGSLRIQVFRDFPYLYDGDLDYERKYLSTYIKTAESFVVLVFDGQKLVGATTSILLKHEEKAFQEPFEKKAYSINEVCYFGESIVLPQYRGVGLGKTFMESRLEFAKGFQNIRFASFCAVVRPIDHPARPKDYKPLDEFWKRYDFAPVSGMQARYSWKDIGDQFETEKSLQFWIKKI